MLITTTRGELEDSLLEKREGVASCHDADGVLHDVTEWVEYWLDGELVHRSAHTTIMRVLPEMQPIIAKLMG